MPVPKQGPASDTAFIATVPFPQTYSGFSGSLFQVNANRSEASSTLPARSVDTDGALAYQYTFGTNNNAYSSEPLEQNMVTGVSDTVAALVRYGSQYTPEGERFDAAISNTLRPGNFANLTAPKNIWVWNFVAGYRSVGSSYEPIDDVFSPILGLHGWYGAAQYSAPAGSQDPTTLALIFHRFSDGIEIRDSSVGMSFNRQFGYSSPFSFLGSFSTAQLTASQVARQLKYPTPLTLAQGEAYLPNSTYSASIQYKPNANLEASAGYSDGYTQNCNTYSKPLPCYAYLQPSVIGSTYVLFKMGLFLTGSVRNQNSIVGGTPWGADVGSFTKQPTTASHVIQSAGAGYIIPGLNCSSLAFTTINRGGTPDAIAANPPVPGYTNTYSINIAPTNYTPGFLLAYSRLGTAAMPPAPATLTSQFLVRALIGVPPKAFAQQSEVPCQ